MYRICFLIVLLLCVKDKLADDDQALWKWNCNNNMCIRVPSAETNLPLYGSIEVCRLVCGNNGALWPLPTEQFVKSDDLFQVDASKITFKVIGTKNVVDIIEENIEIFMKNLQIECGGQCATELGQELKIIITVHSEDISLTWDTDESYKIKSEGLKRFITSETVYGARNGLETLSQLFASSSKGKQSILHTVQSVEIKDSPYYPHRSLLLDTARNFLPVSVIKRQIDAMSASKLNVLHLHATDTQSFPFESQKVPNLTKFGAFSEDKIYSPLDIKELLRYGKVRGVRVIMEIDAPAHAGNGWQWGPAAGLGDLAVCINKNPWRQYCVQPPCGQLNPANKNVYDILGRLYSDIIDQFPEGEIFHMGGDEVFIDCWNSSSEIVNYLTSQGKGQSKEDFLDLWGEFQTKVLKQYDEIVGNSNTPILLWSSDLTNPEHIEKYLNKSRYIIETWVPSTDPLPQQLLNKGFKLIISTKNAWYLDHGFWGTTKYYTWRTAYSNQLIKHKNVLGGEVCMWGELVDDNVVDGRIWPRAAAAAERLWSNPKTSTQTAEPRMYRHRERLVARGIEAEALAPFWCYQNEGQCL